MPPTEPPSHVAGRLPPGGVEELLRRAYELGLSGTVHLGMRDGGAARIELADGRVHAASWQDRAGVSALASMMALAEPAWSIAPRAAPCADEIRLLPPVLLDHLAELGRNLVQEGVAPVRGAEIELPRGTPEELLAAASLRVRSRSETGGLSATDEFPQDFLDQLLPEGMRTQEEEVASDAWVEPAVGYMLGKCYLSAEIGRGATAVVYRAMHLTLKVDVAVKVFRPRPGGPALSVMEEAQLLARLDHPNLLRVLDASDEAPYPHVVMEYVDGTSLEDLVRRSGRLPAQEVLGFLAQAAAGLGHAHREGVIHCDIKPGNCLVGRDDRLRIADLGLARALMSGDQAAGEGTSNVMGTPAYISPEVVRHGVSAATAASDLYSLGATAYHLLAGRPPFIGGDALQTMVMQVHDEPMPLTMAVPACDPRVDRLILRLLAKDPSQRGGDASALAEECTALAQDLGHRAGGIPSAGIFRTVADLASALRDQLDRVLGRR